MLAASTRTVPSSSSSAIAASFTSPPLKKQGARSTAHLHFPIYKGHKMTNRTFTFREAPASQVKNVYNVVGGDLYAEQSKMVVRDVFDPSF